MYMLPAALLLLFAVSALADSGPSADICEAETPGLCADEAISLLQRSGSLARGPVQGTSPAAQPTVEDVDSQATQARLPAQDSQRVWVELLDQASGLRYYENNVTKETTWTRPADELLVNSTLPKDWLVIVDRATGRMYYGNAVSGETQWNKPVLLTPAEAHVGKVMYINMDESVDRRVALEDHLTKRGLSFERVPAVSLEGNAIEHQPFSSADLAKLKEVFAEWPCGDWECPEGDYACCLGLQDAARIVEHRSIGTYPGQPHMSSGLSFVGNLASHINALHQIRDAREASKASSNTSLAPVILTEDDVRFSDDVGQRVSEALSLAGDDWDIIKLYSALPEAGLRGCPKMCGSSSTSTSCLYAVTVPWRCQFWSTAALLVNPKKADHILKAIQKQSQVMTSSIWGPTNKTRLMGQRRSDEVDRSVPMRYSIDWLLTRAAWNRLVKVSALGPPAGSVSMAFESTFATE